MNSIQNKAPFAINHQESGSAPSYASWAVPWSDLMMVMFILFLVLFIFHAREQETVIPRAFFAPWEGGYSQDQSRLDLDPLYERARNILGPDTGRINLENRAGGDLIVSLFGETFFSPGSTELNSDSNYYLERVAEIVSLAQGRIIVSGFADPGREQENAWEISSMRAARIGQILSDSGQIRKENITVHGHGSSQPVVPESSPVSGERNRRVEVRILSDQSG
ncbi:MAG: flagellar motor protein MotB [Desulfonatronovibrio sp.]